MKYLFKVFRKIILGEQREIKLAYELAEIIKNYSKNSHIKILDYGSGFEPKIARLIETELLNKQIKCDIHCLDLYNINDLESLNNSSNIEFFHINHLVDSNEFYDFAIISDTLHHVGVENTEVIKGILLKIKNATEVLIIKDHFEYSIFSRWVLKFMDFIGNYYNNVNIPKKYFTKNSFNELLVELNLNINEKFLDKRYYSKIFLYLSNPKLHFIYVIS